MAGFFRPPEKLVITDNVAQDWVLFKEQFKLFLKATEADSKSDVIKIAQLLNVIGSEALSIFQTFKLGSIDTLKFNDVLSEFDKHFSPTRNVTYQRFLFFKRVQKEGEPFINFLTDLKKLASYCSFGDQEESLIRDRLVLCIRDEALQERLLRYPDLKLADAVKQCQLAEQSREQLDAVKLGEFNKQAKGGEFTTLAAQQPTSGISFKEEMVHAVQGQYRRSKTADDIRLNRSSGKVGYSYSRAYLCKKCNTSHTRAACPAYNKTCLNCGELNHFAVGCQKPRSKNPNKFGPKDTRSDSSKSVNEVFQAGLDCPEFKIDGISIKTVNDVKVQSQNCWLQTVMINENPVSFKLDTGAEVNLIPLDVLNKCKPFELNKSSLRLESYGGFKLETLGKVNLNCKLNGVETIEEFVVIKPVGGKCVPILGLKTCVQLGLIARVHDVMLKSKEEFVKVNKDVFTGIGCFPYEYKIRLKENANPVVKSPRRVPNAILPRLKATLENLEELSIICRNDSPGSYVSNLVIVKKPDKSLRLCLDPQALNQDIKPEPYLIPTMDEIKSILTGKTCFSVLDLKDGFFHVKLDTESSDMCTFSSPFGCYSFRRLPFGLSVAPQLFHKLNSKIFSNIEGVTVYFDDILVAAPSEESHDKILAEVIERAKVNGVKFNPKKLQYRMNKVNFVGHVFSCEGVCVDNKHIESIVKLSNPTSKKELQRVLGMFNYFREHIPNMSSLISPLRELLRKDTNWQWLPIHSDCIEKLKCALISAPVLASFDTNKPIEIHADSSKDAVGYCLIQAGRPVSFGSRSLTETESQYAQVEKEMLSIVVAVKKFHNLVYGKPFVVYNDSKPLESILQKPIHKVMSPRLQRFKLKLLNYDITIKYRPGNSMVVADMLSRVNYTANVSNVISNSVDVVIPNELAISEAKKLEFREATRNDPALSVVCKYYYEGWPEKSKVPEQVKVFYNQRGDLYVNDGMVFLNDKIVVPYCLRSSMLKLLHQHHFGIEKTKARARELIYWPGMTNDIENVVIQCSSCNKYMNSSAKEPLKSHEIPDLPFYKVGVDIAEIGPNIYLILVDYFSKWVECVNMNCKTTTEVIRCLKPIFSSHGIPLQVVGDNNPFGSFEFKEFSKEWGFEVVNTSPLYPRSNGQVERTVQTIKKMLRKCHDSNQDFQLALLEYRNTPVVAGLSPAQILMSRRLRTKVPVSKTLLQPNLSNLRDLKEAIVAKQSKSAQNYNKTTKPKAELKPLDLVYVYNLKSKMWQQGQIVGLSNMPRSYLVKMENGRVLRRNSFYLRPRVDNPNVIRVSNHDDDLYYVKQSTQSSPNVTPSNRSVVSPQQSSTTTASRPITPRTPSTPRSHLSSPLSRNVSPNGSSPLSRSVSTNVSRGSNDSNMSPRLSPETTDATGYKTRFGRVTKLPLKFQDYESN